MRYYLSVFFLFISFCAFAQSANEGKKKRIEAKVYDGKHNEPVSQAQVRLLAFIDSAYVAGVGTSDDGIFVMSAISGKYILEVSFLGFETYSRQIELAENEPVLDLGKIELSENTILLKETTIEAKVPDIVVKGDTIEYNAASYSRNESDVLQDLIRNIEGIEIDKDGNLTAKGKPILKILVDGKEFFGNDIPLTLSNLPASMIKKIQFYKEESENAKVTGIKDKEPQQVLNLVVKEELKHSTFGNLHTGHGTDDKYSYKGMLNHMRGDNQTSFVGNLNSTNLNLDYMTNSGININRNVGTSTNNQFSDKFTLGTNIRYANNESMDETVTEKQTFITTGDRFSNQKYTNNSLRQSLHGGFNISWEPDSLTTIYVRSSFGLTDSNDENTNFQESYLKTKKDSITTTHDNSKSKGKGFNMNNSLVIGRKLNDKGRTLSLSLGYALRNDKTEGSKYSYTDYPQMPDVVVDQKSTTKINSNTFNIHASYVEPLGKGYLLQFAYTANNSNGNRDRDTRKKDALGNYTLIDSAYSRNTRNEYFNQGFNLNFQAEKEKYNYTMGFSADPSISRSLITLGDSTIENVKQKVVNFSPNLNFSYTPNPDTNLSIDYSGSTSQPSINQLSGDTVILSSVNRVVGQPGLKPSYDNNVNIYFQKSDFENNRFLMIMAGFRYTFSSIVDFTRIDTLGNTLTTYRNLDGNMGGNFSVMYNTPFRNKRFTINTNSHINYYRNAGYMNESESVTNNLVLSENLSLKFRNDKVETVLLAVVNHNIAKNNLTDAGNLTTTNYRINNTLDVKLPFDISFQNDISYSHFAGYGEGFKKNEILWNASISKLFLKKKSGTLKLQCFDILNDRNNLQRNVTSNGITNSRTNTVNRYIILSFMYRFNIIKGKQSEPEMGDMYY